MSVLQHMYDSQQLSNNTNDRNIDHHSLPSSTQNSVARNPSFKTITSLKSCRDETTTAGPAMNRREEIALTSMNHTTAAQSTTKQSVGSQTKTFIIGLILGVLVAGIALITVVVLWQKSGSNTTTSSTSGQNVIILINTTAVSTTTTTSKTTSSSTTSSTTSTTATTSSTSSSSTTSTTTTAPPSSLCVTSSGQGLTNNSFIYSPTSQTYAAGMLNNQFGVYQAYGYRNVTSTAIWAASQSSTSQTCFLALQMDRHLVVYMNTVNGSIAVWASNTVNNGTGTPFCLQMLDTGNLIWIDNTNSIIWESNSTVTSG